MSQRNSRDTTQTNKQTKNKQNTSAEDFTGNDTEQECKRKRPRPRSNPERERKKNNISFFFQIKTTVALLFFFFIFLDTKKWLETKGKRKEVEVGTRNCAHSTIKRCDQRRKRHQSQTTRTRFFFFGQKKIIIKDQQNPKRESLSADRV